MLYQKSTIIRDDDWGHFIDIDDMQINFPIKWYVPQSHIIHQQRLFNG